MSRKILILPGDGIGPEIMQHVQRLLETMTRFGFDAELEHALLGGAAIDAEGAPMSEATLALAGSADAVLLGAGGRTEVGRPADGSSVRSGVCWACARASACSPICARRSCSRSSPRRPRSSPSWCPVSIC
ncbi:MAG: isocitrate/isopropylmalate family dehydrogenase [Gammaproteobacteria bacterium]|nr:isocitrate/isopropylmalate family dehydrogenase [Gammaproteobacteria bacterium]